MEGPSRYLVGVDLGTTNSAVAFVDTRESANEGDSAGIRIFEVAQLTSPGEVRVVRTLAFHPLFPNRRRSLIGYSEPAVGTTCVFDRRNDGPRPRRPRAGAAGIFGEILAVPECYRSNGQHSAAGSGAARTDAVSRRSVCPLPHSSAERLEPCHGGRG